MFRPHFLVLLALLVPLPAIAAEPASSGAEQLLPASAQFYFRWDGSKAHAKEFDLTAMGKILQGDTGKFVDGLFTQIKDSLGGALNAEQLLQGIPPQQLKKIQQTVKEVPKLFSLLSEKGIILSAELKQIDPPQSQLFLIVPNAGDRPEPILGLLQLFTSLAGVEVKEKLIEGRSVSTVSSEMIHVLWWVEKTHFVFVVSSEPADVVVKRMTDTKLAKLPNNPLYKKIVGFKDFTTAARAYVDFTAILTPVRKINPKVEKLINESGLSGLQNVVFYSGFDGLAERGYTEMELAKTRTGLLKPLGGKFKLSDLPAMPPDVMQFSAGSADFAGIYDEVLKLVKTGLKEFAPEQEPLVDGFLKQADDLLGISLRKDLLGSLGDKALTYLSPSEGLLNLGSVYAIQLKDSKRAKAALETAIKNLGKLSPTDVRLKRSTYQNVEITQVAVPVPGMFFTPTYAFHKDWLVVSLYPQPVQAYIARNSQNLDRWKPDPITQAHLDKMPKDMTAINYSDPKPTVQQMLVLAPMLATVISNLSPEFQFDVSTLPNSQEVTRHLFPNLTISTDEGTLIKQDSRVSLAMPFATNGLEAYVLFAGAVGVYQSRTIELK